MNPFSVQYQCFLYLKNIYSLISAIQIERNTRNFKAYMSYQYSYGMHSLGNQQDDEREIDAFYSKVEHESSRDLLLRENDKRRMHRDSGTDNGRGEIEKMGDDGGKCQEEGHLQKKKQRQS